MGIISQPFGTVWGIDTSLTIIATFYGAIAAIRIGDIARKREYEVINLLRMRIKRGPETYPISGPKVGYDIISSDNQ